jgi:predicted DNA-binding transcriptional regulator YafY
MTSSVVFESVAMRASRLLQMLLLLQNRGRLTCAALAVELEVSRRTILRDVDALTEAGLPVVVIRGNQGGIELGFNYRTRLTGLSADEAEALAVTLSHPAPALDELGIRTPASRAVAKLAESFPDGVRAKMEQARQRFRFQESKPKAPDPRLPALAAAIRERRIVHICANTPARRAIHPLGLIHDGAAWNIVDAREPYHPIPLSRCGDINVSARRFDDDQSPPRS